MALDITKPTDDNLLINFPGQCRANWEAIVLGTDPALLIANDKVSPAAAIVDTKLAQITTAGKVSGAALVLLPNIPAGAGIIPVANLPVGTIANKIVQLDASAKIPAVDGSLLTALNGAVITGIIPVASIDTGTDPNKIVKLGVDGKLPAVDGSNLTGLSAVSPESDTDAGTAYTNSDYVVFLSKAKTITSGKTVLLIATGYLSTPGATVSSTLRLKQGSTVVQTVTINPAQTASYMTGWAMSGIVTGVSGSITFSVEIISNNAGTSTVYGNLEILEF